LFAKVSGFQKHPDNHHGENQTSGESKSLKLDSHFPPEFQQLSSHFSWQPQEQLFCSIIIFK
jgi:hypothetical protein